MKKKVNRLKDISISEISLVDLAAVGVNGKNFLLYKRLSDENLPLDVNEWTPEQMEAINQEFEALSDSEKEGILKELEWIVTLLEVQEIEKTMDRIKKEDSFLYAEICHHGERFDVSDDFQEIVRKQKASAPETRERFYDEVNGRWVWKNIKRRA
jgi:hypothetical protein